MNIDCEPTVGIIVRADKMHVSRVLRKVLGDDDGLWESLYYSFCDSYVPDVDDQPDDGGMGCITVPDLLILARLVEAFEAERCAMGLSVSLMDKTGVPAESGPGHEHPRASAWVRWSDRTFPTMAKDAEIFVYPGEIDTTLRRAANRASRILAEALAGRPVTVEGEPAGE